MRGVFHLVEMLIVVLIGIGYRKLIWDPMLAPVAKEFHWLNPIVGMFLVAIPIVLAWWLIRRKVYAWLRGKGWY